MLQRRKGEHRRNNPRFGHAAPPLALNLKLCFELETQVLIGSCCPVPDLKVNSWLRKNRRPGSGPGEITNGTSAIFDGAREQFERAWRVFLAKRTEADFEEWRDQRDWTARKYAIWERGEPMPSQQ
jgi:hypothetical protein